MSWAVIALAVLVLAGSALAQEPSSDPRVRLRDGVKREALDAEGQALYDSVVNAATPYGRGLPAPLGMWVHSPKMAQHVLPLYMYLRFGGDAGDAIYFPVRLVELAILVAAREINMKLFGTSGVTDLAGLMAFYEFLYSSSNATFDIQVPPGQQPLLPTP